MSKIALFLGCFCVFAVACGDDDVAPVTCGGATCSERQTCDENTMTCECIEPFVGADCVSRDNSKIEHRLSARADRQG